MKTTQSSGTHPDHQTVAGTFEFKTNGKAIAIGFTEQQLSPHAGSATFWGWVHRLDWRRTLAAALPHPLPTSNNQILPLEKALAFMHGLLCDARKLTHVAYLRRDPLAGELLGIRRIASQSVRSRFFQGFGSAGGNLRCFRPLWHWCLHRLPSGKDGGGGGACGWMTMPMPAQMCGCLGYFPRHPPLNIHTLKTMDIRAFFIKRQREPGY